MNSSERNELIDSLLDGGIAEADFLRLEAVLSVDPAARKAYFDRVALTQALTAEASAPLTKQGPAVTKPRNVWLQWRPLTAAAAGLVLGMFCTSMVYGLVVQPGMERKTPLAVVQPGFEDPQMPLAQNFPDASARWGGDAAHIVAAENGVSAKEGKFMLRLEASAKGSPRIVYQVLDLTTLPPGAEGEMREIEISASFAAANAESSARCMIRAFAVAEAREHLDAAWFDRRDEAIASASRGLDVMPGNHGWQTFGLRIQVPSTARSLVLFFGVRTPDKTLPKAAHYLDDVRVSLIEPQPLP